MSDRWAPWSLARYPRSAVVRASVWVVGPDDCLGECGSVHGVSERLTDLQVAQRCATQPEPQGFDRVPAPAYLLHERVPPELVSERNRARRREDRVDVAG